MGRKWSDTDIIRVSPKGIHAFFGYYNLNPVCANNRFLLIHSTAFGKRMPRPGEPAQIEVIDLHDQYKSYPVAQTYAWNWQQGAMLQWYPFSGQDSVIFNDVQDGRLISRLLNVNSGKSEVIPRPVYALSSTKKTALSINFTRLHHVRPGYGYVALYNPQDIKSIPHDDGVWTVNIDTKQDHLLFSIKDLVASMPSEETKKSIHWVNHLEFSPSGNRFAFLHRWFSGHSIRTRLMTSDLKSGIRCLLDTGHVSHYTWKNNRDILVWANDNRHKQQYLIVTDSDSDTKLSGFCPGLVEEDGHPSYSPNGKYVLTDTYPSTLFMKKLLLIDASACSLHKLGQYFSPIDFRKGYRNDLHPRWVNDHLICFDSTHEGERAVYLKHVIFDTPDSRLPEQSKQ